jgi:hypothetical protein
MLASANTARRIIDEGVRYRLALGGISAAKWQGRSEQDVATMALLVTSAAGTNGDGYGALLAFNGDGKSLGAFGDDNRIADPRGLAVAGRSLFRRLAKQEHRYGVCAST